MFYNPALFNFTQEFENNWHSIREEYLNLDSKILDLHRDKYSPHEKYVDTLLYNNGWTPSWQANSNEPNYNWLTYALSYQGLFPQEAEHKFPITARLLTRLKGFRVCVLSLMKPFSFIRPHSHADLGGNLLSFHLGVDVVVGKSYLCVDGTFEEEHNKKSIVFDASREHYAFNMSNVDRAILYMEFDKTKIAFE